MPMQVEITTHVLAYAYLHTQYSPKCSYTHSKMPSLTLVLTLTFVLTFTHSLTHAITDTITHTE